MKKTLVVILLTIIPIYFLTISGCESTTGVNYGTGVIQGNIKDSTSAINLEGVEITTSPATTTVLTNASGNYEIQNVNDGTFTIIAKKPGYFTRYTSAEILNADTAIANARMMSTGVYVYSGLTVVEYINNNSLSGVNLKDGIVIDEVLLNDPNKDIQLRDSAGTSTNFYLRSGDLALNFAGSKTGFGLPLTNPKTGQQSFTATEFDTLSKIYDFDGVNFFSYFNLDRTSYFNAPGMTNSVYPFWLEGRNTNPTMFGVIYLRNSYIGTDNKFYLEIIIKINKLGFNILNNNQ